MDISSIIETQNKIEIKFGNKLKWTDSRATFYNLKKRMIQNILEATDLHRLWIPKLIYRNNKDNDDTRSMLKKSTLMIDRKGNFSRSCLDSLDEIEIFKGEENPLILMQSYTKEFKCKYTLQAFPFDTQVRLTTYYNDDLLLFRYAT